MTANSSGLPPSGLGRLPITPTTVNSFWSNPDLLAERVDRLEQRLRRRVAEHDDVAAVLDLEVVEEPALRPSPCS